MFPACPRCPVNIWGITTKEPCGAPLIHERHICMEIFGFVMHAFDLVMRIKEFLFPACAFLCLPFVFGNRFFHPVQPFFKEFARHGEVQADMPFGVADEHLVASF